jgi:hypothetical protein
MARVCSIAGLLAPFILAFAINEVRAAPADSCKICRDSRQACLKNHSRDACNTEYGICMKHCRPR